MKRKLTAMLLATSFFAAGSAYAASSTAAHLDNNYSYSPSGKLQTWSSPPDMEPNIAPVVITLGRMFGTWVAKNHVYVWGTIVGVLDYAEELGDGTLSGNADIDYEDKGWGDTAEVCSTYDTFNNAGSDEQSSGLGGEYGDEYSVSEIEMGFLDWFCAAAPMP